MSVQQYSAFLAQHHVQSNTPDAVMVNRVGRNIQNAVIGLAKKKGFSKITKEFKWEYNLVQDDLVNAFCMPGGKIVIYTGILPITQNENGLAIVMGHEVAHAIARHGNERMSQMLAAQAGLIALDVFLATKTDKEKRDLFMTAAGLGFTVGVLLPFSRKHESEADELGLIFAAAAGYDPSEGIAFWTRMAAKGGAGAPEFLSTHPSHETRINDIKTKYLPEAMKYYKK